MSWCCGSHWSGEPVDLGVRGEWNGEGTNPGCVGQELPPALDLKIVPEHHGKCVLISQCPAWPALRAPRLPSSVPSSCPSHRQDLRAPGSGTSPSPCNCPESGPCAPPAQPGSWGFVPTKGALIPKLKGLGSRTAAPEGGWRSPRSQGLIGLELAAPRAGSAMAK